MRYATIDLPPHRWTWSDVKGLAYMIAVLLAPWAVIGTVVVAILFAIHVLP